MILAQSIHVHAVNADMPSWTAANECVGTTCTPGLYIHIPHYVGRILYMDVILSKIILIFIIFMLITRLSAWQQL